MAHAMDCSFSLRDDHMWYFSGFLAKITAMARYSESLSGSRRGVGTFGVTLADREPVKAQMRLQEVESDTEEEDVSLDPEKKTAGTVLDIFSKDVRGRTALGVFLMGMQQLSGIDGVPYVCSSNPISFFIQGVTIANESSSTPRNSFRKPDLPL